MSLAKHVSTQVGCSVGKIVGYQVGNSKKVTDETKVLFVTDFTMLKMCSEDPLFEKVSCIIIDEAHERSIYTDLLLGMVKKSLFLRPNIRVIITSATLKVNLFQMYFGLSNDAIINVSGRTFPIEDIWLSDDVQVGWNYFDKTLNIAVNLLDQDAGDILAFLPTPVETEKAVEKFESMVKNKTHKLSIHKLHGKLDVQEQQKVFEKTPQGTRKVVFSTNCAETSVTIPGIRYVIDSGMVKEAQYDAVRNINVLAVGFVNRSSAEQRRGRAGRTQSGKCYRLYSHHNYDNDMADNMVPEILRVNLGQALLKLMLLGVKNPLEFDFVESPPQISMITAMKQLIHLGAVDQNSYKLTEHGLQIAALPLEPRLCHVMLKGIQAGVGYEAVVVAALATVSRNIFFRNSGNKDDADLKKIKFCQSESDYLTFLEVYKEWCDVPKATKSHWCVANCINGRSMKLAHELVNELTVTLSGELNIKLSAKFSDNFRYVPIMHKIIFHSFSENLCIYSGYDKIGYLSLDITGSLIIHPSSSLCSLGKWRPKYVVYDCILKTSQPFLINVTAVDEDTLSSAIQDGLLRCDINQLKSLPFNPIVYSGLGCHVLKSLLGIKGSFIRTLESNLKEICQGNACGLDLDFDAGKLSVYAPAEFRESAGSVFTETVEGLRGQLHSEERVLGDFIDLPSLSAIFVAGCKVRDVILPGEYRDVVIRPADSDCNAVVGELQKYGELVHVKNAKRCKYVTYRNVASAKLAVQEIAKMNLPFTVTPGASFAPSEPTAFFKVLISFLRRPCTGTCFFSIKPLTSISEVSYILSRRSVIYKSSHINISISKKCNDDFFVKNVPPDVIEEELKGAISKNLPEEVEITKFIIIREKEFESSKTDIELIKKQIMKTFGNFTAHHKLHVDVNPPKPKDKYWKACVCFNNPHDGQHVVNIMNSHRFRSEEIFNRMIGMKPILETNLSCSKEIYHAIEKEIDDALEFFNQNTSDIKTLEINAKCINSGKRVLICISGNNISDVIDAKKALQRFIQGNQIECTGKPLLEKLFVEKHKRFLICLSEKIPYCHVNLNHQTKVVTIFGSSASYTTFNIELNRYLDILEREMGSTTNISLKSLNSSRSLLKEVTHRYGLDLEKLIEECKLSSAKVDVHKHVLNVSGSESSISQCKEIIAAISTEIGAEIESSSGDEHCPVCYCEITSPFYRLEYCGHSYCEMCILYQLNSVESTPVLCCFEDCNKPFVLRDFFWAVQQMKTLKNKIYSKALESFMKTNKEVKHCPTPDCSMMYRVSTVNQDYGTTCTSCLNDICTKCGILYHVGMSCHLYQMLKSDDNYSLQLWLKADPENHKICPSCEAPIEKDGGCMHMTCWKCNCHMCWRCMKKFPSGDDVYNHQSNCPATKPPRKVLY